MARPTPQTTQEGIPDDATDYAAAARLIAKAPTRQAVLTAAIESAERRIALYSTQNSPQAADNLRRAEKNLRRAHERNKEFQAKLEQAHRTYAAYRKAHSDVPAPEDITARGNPRQRPWGGKTTYTRQRRQSMSYNFTPAMHLALEDFSGLMGTKSRSSLGEALILQGLASLLGISPQDVEQGIKDDYGPTERSGNWTIRKQVKQLLGGTFNPKTLQIELPGNRQ